MSVTDISSELIYCASYADVPAVERFCIAPGELKLSVRLSIGLKLQQHELKEDQGGTKYSVGAGAIRFDA